MKRDFREEYNNYIESDMSDLWSRIEPNLKEKLVTGQTEETKKNKAKIYRFVKVATPIAAGFCVLVIGVGVMSIRNKSMEETMESATAGDADVMEESVAEEPMEETTMESVAEDFEEAEEFGITNSVATDEALMEEMPEDAIVEDMAQSESESIKEGVKTESSGAEAARQKEFEIPNATLLRIAKASESERDAGLAYIYVFRLEDDSKIEVYVTNEMCDEWEATDSKLQRQEKYILTVCLTSDTMNKEEDFSADYILQEVKKLP